MNNFKEYEIDNAHCMGGWYISESICDNLINFFKINSHLHSPGLSFTKDIVEQNSNIKESLDLAVEPDMNYFPLNEYRVALQECLINFMNKYEIMKEVERYDIIEPFNIQYYKPNGGFKTWHFENGTKTKRSRVLVFMTYLNNVEDGGTEFKHQNITTPAKKGLTLIWPTHWTHLHKGQISKSEEKYIITGWYSFLDEDKKNK